MILLTLFPRLSASERQRERRKTPEGKAAQKAWNLTQRLKQLGIPVEQYEAMLKKQNGLCAVCKKRRPCNRGGSDMLNVDHCHKTGKIRGLLCGHCNRVLGLVEDSPKLLEALAAYLRAA
jgi:hypothetical protein